jgi:transcription-repair coupling factor (superfamily II helicase)
VDALLKLIRNEPKVYRFDGRGKLTVTLSTATAQARLEAVEKLLLRLSPRAAVRGGA